MKINAVNNDKHVGFKSIRTDKHTIEKLKNGTTPISENNRINIYTALNNLSTDSTRSNIEFLLGIAENLNYGQNGNSEFKKILDEDGITPSDRENIHWDEILKDTINKAIGNSKETTEDLQAQADKIFSTEKSLTPEQKELLDLRQTLTDKLIENTFEADSETLSQITDIRQNIDYFIASSEIPMNQKKYCLEKFQYLLSEDYNINPQLKDKKLQILDEMLNDMLIKTPKDEVMTTKGVDQLYSGICGAISVCRKAVAYEDKSKYVDIVLNELDDTNEMTVYDVTELGSGKKTTVRKANVDYDSALRKGYRILDASAHIWMQNARTMGDGSFDYMTYVPFSDEDFGIYDDGFWYDNSDNSEDKERDLLRTLIKEKKFVKSVLQTRKKIQNTYSNLRNMNKQINLYQSYDMKKLISIFKEIFPQKSEIEQIYGIKSLIKFYTDIKTNNEANISSKMPDELKEKILQDYIEDKNLGMTQLQKDKLSDNIKEINETIIDYVESDNKIKKLKSYSSNTNKYYYNKNLYKAAAAHRIAFEQDLNIEENITRYEKLFNLPPREIRMANYIKLLQLKQKGENVLMPDGTTLSNSEFNKQAETDIFQLQVVIPHKLDEICKIISGKTMSENIASIYNYYIDKISKGDKEAYLDILSVLPEKKEKEVVLKKLKANVNILNNNPTNTDVLRCIQYLGFNSEFEITNMLINNVYNGISQETYDRLAELFGGKDQIGNGLRSTFDEYNNLAQEYNNIILKWDIPTAGDTIIKELEKRNWVLSINKLEILKNKFNKIDIGRAKNSKIENLKEQRKANNELFKFSQDENQIFDDIEKNLGRMKRYSNSRYTELNNKLKENLEKDYAKIGMLSGQFYVAQEGSSGLSSQSILRIMEMIMGKPYHIENYLQDGAKEIKEGETSGIINMSVQDDDFGFHAMYVPSVKTESFVNPITKEQKNEDVMWADNTWGKSEKQKFWDSQNGFLYTDYSNGYGLKNGFILAPDYKIGLPVDYLKHAQGKVKNEDFSIFTNMVLPGNSQRTIQKTFNILNNIIRQNDDKIIFDLLEQKLLAGEKIDIKKLESLDDAASDYYEKILNRVTKEIKTKDDFDKLDKDDPVKFIFNKLALYFATQDTEIRNQIAEIDNYESLAQLTEEIFDDKVEEIMTITGKSNEVLQKIFLYSNQPFNDLLNEIKTQYNIELNETQKNELMTAIFANEEAEKDFDGSLDKTEKIILNNIVEETPKFIKDEKALEYFIKKALNIVSNVINENIRITSLDCKVLTENIMAPYLINAVDKYLSPDDDEELLAVLQGLQKGDNELVVKFFDKLTEEDVGLKIREPYDYIVKAKDYNSSVINALYEIAGSQAILKNINSSKKNQPDTAEELYRAIHNKLSYLDIQKFIKGYKDEALRKYSVRPAYPNPVFIEEQNIAEATDNLFLEIKNRVEDIQNLDNLNQIVLLSEEIKSKLENSNIQEKGLQPSDKDSVLESLNLLYLRSAQYDDFGDISTGAIELSNLLKNTNGSIDKGKIDEQLNKIFGIVNHINNFMFDSESSEDKITAIKKELYKYINNTINANILSRYKNDAKSKINQIIKLRQKEDNEQAEEKENEFKEFITDKFILKNPDEVLNRCVTLLQEGKKDSAEYSAMKNYLNSALNKAQKAYIQYKLIENQHEGAGSKIKSVLPLFNVYYEDGSYESMANDKGLVYLVQELNSISDNNETMNLFLNQSGLSDKAFKSVAENLDFSKLKKYIDSQRELIYKYTDSIKTLQSCIDEFVTNNNMNYQNAHEALENMFEYVKRKLPEQNSKIYKTAIELFNETLKEENYKTVTDKQRIYNVMYVVNESILDYLCKILLNQLSDLSSQQDLMQNQALLLNSFELKNNEEENKLLDESIKKCADFQHYIANNIKKVSEYINKLDFITLFTE